MKPLEAALRRAPAPYRAALYGGLLLLPTLLAGRVFDDYALDLQAHGHFAVAHSGPFDLFRFADGDVLHGRARLEQGIFPWFARDDARLAFFRPLASLTHYVDFAVLRLPAWLMHLENVAVYAGFVLLAGVLFQRTLRTPREAALATWMVAVQPANAWPAGWIANRNALLAATFAMAAWVAHDRARREGWWPGIWLGPACFALALASGEVGVMAFGFVLAHALALDRASLRSRILAALPYVVVFAVWHVAYRALGYGTFGSALYVDPATAPLAFLRQATVHLPVLAAGASLLLPPEATLGLSGSALVAWVLLASSATFATIAALGPLLRREPSARWLALGSLGALVPACTTFPAARLLMIPGVGVAGLLAMLAADVIAAIERRRWVRGFSAALVAVHAAVAAVLLPFFALMPGALEWFARSRGNGLPTTAELDGKRVVLVRSTSFVAGLYRFAIPDDGTPRAPRSIRMLAIGWGETSVRRVDATTLRLENEKGLTSDLVCGLLRDTPVAENEVFRLSDMTATVERTAGGSPTVVSFRFSRPLEEENRVWIAWDRGHYVPFPLPAVGEAVELRD